MHLVRILLLLLIATFVVHAQTPVKIKVQLNWKHQFEHAGFYAAIEQGYYQELGLEVELFEKRKDFASFDAIVSKDVQFAVGYSSLVLEYVNDKPVVALASIFQHSPLVFLAKKSSNIRSVSDMIERRVMINPDSKSSASLNAMVKKAGLSYDEMQLFKHTHNINDLIDDTVEVMASYISNQPYALIEKDISYNIIDPVNYGYDFYENILFTHKDIAETNPVLVEKFLKATLKGWEYALRNADDIIELILREYNTQNKSKEALAYEADIIKQSLVPKNIPIGDINKERFQRILFLYEELGLIEQKRKDLEPFIYKRKEGVKLSIKEQEWIEQHPQIYFTGDPNWLPYEAFDNGIYKGIVNEHLSLIEEYSGLKFVKVPSKTWSESIQNARKKKVDVLSETTSSLLQDELTFTKSYLSSPIVMVMREEETFKDSIEAISDKRIAIIKDYGYVTEIQEHYPNLNYVIVDTIQEGLMAVENKKVDVLFCALPQASYWTKKLGLQKIRVVGKTEFEASLAFGIRSDYPVLVSIMNKAISFIPPAKQQAILKKWSQVQYSPMVDYTLIWVILGSAVVIIIGLIARQITLHRYNKELTYLSQTDNLTKLYNRGKLNEVLKERWSFFKRYDEPLGVIIMDLDHFKKVNDCYGHDIGDEVLVELSQLLLTYIRDVDTVGRWGGEEFLVIAPRMDEEGLKILAEKLRVNMEKTSLSTVGPVTGSFGLAISNDDDTISSLLKRADVALYQAKNTGRNRVVYQ